MHPELCGPGPSGAEQYSNHPTPIDSILPPPGESQLRQGQIDPERDRPCFGGSQEQNLLQSPNIPIPNESQRKFPRQPDFNRWPEFGFPPILGGSGDLRELYKEQLRALQGLNEEEIEEITRVTFDKAGWAEKDEVERKAYQERLERQISAIKIVNAWLAGKMDLKFE
jgi:hypothetical protein